MSVDDFRLAEWSLGNATAAPFEHVLRSVGSHPGGAEMGVSRILKTGSSEEQLALTAFMAGLPDAEVGKVRASRDFLLFHKGNADSDRQARLDLTKQICSQTAHQRRLSLLRTEEKAARPEPYAMAPLAGLTVDADHLVSLADFKDLRGAVETNGYAGQLLTTNESTNSTYWLAQAINRLGGAESARIRLDPFIHGPRADFPMMVYMMRVYGAPFDWARIGGLQQAEHGRWQTTDGIGVKATTEYVWEPRGGEVHFEAEEIPLSPNGPLTGCRYIHAVYNPDQGTVTHFDGALRVLDAEELADRRTKHLRNAGKTGVRAKVFRIDGQVDRDAFATVVKSFFVWNQDISDYFDTLPGAAQA